MSARHYQSSPDTDLVRKKSWWKRWQNLAAIATCIVALPTIGIYANHVSSVWAAPDRLDDHAEQIRALTEKQTEFIARQDMQTEAIARLERDLKISDQKLDQIIGYLRADIRARAFSSNTNMFQ